MNKKATNIIADILSVVAMLLIIVAVFFSAFQLVTYGPTSRAMFAREYEKYDAASSLNMDMDGIMEVNDVMMEYLIGNRDELSIETVVDGEFQDFFNDHDRTHMKLVQNMFVGALHLRVWILIAASCFLFVSFIIKRGKSFIRILPRSYNIALGVFAAFLAVFGIACAVNFNAVFIKFHEIFFSNDEWLFDPAEDYMIRMLPEGFFSDMVLYILLTFVALLLLIFLALFILTKKTRKIE